MKKFSTITILFLLIFSFSTQIALWIWIHSDDTDKESCYTYHSRIESWKVKKWEVFWVISNIKDIVAYQDNTTSLKVKFIWETKWNLGFAIEWFKGTYNNLFDGNYETFSKLAWNEVMINFAQTIEKRKVEISLIDNSVFHERIFTYSNDGKEFFPLDIYNISDYTFKHIKISFVPKATKTENDKEEIFVSELNVKEIKNLLAVEAKSSWKIDFYSDFHCTSWAIITPNSNSITLSENANKYDINLLSSEEKNSLKGAYLTQITIKAEQISTSTLPIVPEPPFPPAPIDVPKITHISIPKIDALPSWDTLVYTALWCMIIIWGSLYFREKIRSKCAPWLSPQNIIHKLKSKKWVLFNIKKSEKKLINTISLFITWEKKEQKIKGKKLTHFFEVLLSHYEKNKEIFKPGELKLTYSEILDEFKHYLSKKENWKAKKLISKFIEKWWKVVINTKDSKNNKKKKWKV